MLQGSQVVCDLLWQPDILTQKCLTFQGSQVVWDIIQVPDIITLLSINVR